MKMVTKQLCGETLYTVDHNHMSKLEVVGN
jgi:hypothetical protein